MMRTDGLRTHCPPLLPPWTSSAAAPPLRRTPSRKVRCRARCAVRSCDACADDRNATGAVFDYGTAGFRTLASRLDAVAFRAGAVAAARSAACGGAATGLVITVRCRTAFASPNTRCGGTSRLANRVAGVAQPGGGQRREAGGPVRRHARGARVRLLGLSCATLNARRKFSGALTLLRRVCVSGRTLACARPATRADGVGGARHGGGERGGRSSSGRRAARRAVRIARGAAARPRRGAPGGPRHGAAGARHAPQRPRAGGRRGGGRSLAGRDRARPGCDAREHAPLSHNSRNHPPARSHSFSPPRVAVRPCLTPHAALYAPSQAS
jgi:hypothetical protein